MVKPYGLGILINPLGRKYEGEWKDDNRHGQGTFSYITGSSYSGEWNLSLIHI